MKPGIRINMIREELSNHDESFERIVRTFREGRERGDERAKADQMLAEIAQLDRETLEHILDLASEDIKS